ncbi:unnamed protein product [Vitrella brassicaformis CCMP3155]|uniref:EGF-like domain-containing protein n=1 Tax=Vitrella brassicaformis (strain CCMP3155) TaxID=1169540 RepID=A0A0G4FU38_VITBC|nr:unnamed protein product [Vitrella brassicaformis CCMP3155]|eukprot:CEM18121.1 unnamed protein product [Vitrella brassicaformis CCMP3155]
MHLPSWIIIPVWWIFWFIFCASGRNEGLFAPRPQYDASSESSRNIPARGLQTEPETEKTGPVLARLSPSTATDEGYTPYVAVDGALISDGFHVFDWRMTDTRQSSSAEQPVELHEFAQLQPPFNLSITPYCVSVMNRTVVVAGKGGSVQQPRKWLFVFLNIPSLPSKPESPLVLNPDITIEEPRGVFQSFGRTTVVDDVFHRIAASDVFRIGYGGAIIGVGAVYVFGYDPIAKTSRRIARLRLRDRLRDGYLGIGLALEGDIVLVAGTDADWSDKELYVFSVSDVSANEINFVDVFEIARLRLPTDDAKIEAVALKGTIAAVGINYGRQALSCVLLYDLGEVVRTNSAAVDLSHPFAKLSPSDGPSGEIRLAFDGKYVLVVVGDDYQRYAYVFRVESPKNGVIQEAKELWRLPVPFIPFGSDVAVSHLDNASGEEAVVAISRLQQAGWEARHWVWLLGNWPIPPPTEDVTCASPPQVPDASSVCPLARSTSSPGCRVICKEGFQVVRNDLLCTTRGNFTGCPECQDIDECAEGTAACNKNATCKNTAGGYECICQDGFEPDGEDCKDIDECETNNGGCEHTCNNTVGSFECSCDEGYQLFNDSKCSTPELYQIYEALQETSWTLRWFNSSIPLPVLRMKRPHGAFCPTPIAPAADADADNPIHIYGHFHECHHHSICWGADCYEWDECSAQDVELTVGHTAFGTANGKAVLVVYDGSEICFSVNADDSGTLGCDYACLSPNPSGASRNVTYNRSVSTKWPGLSVKDKSLMLVAYPSTTNASTTLDVVQRGDPAFRVDAPTTLIPSSDFDCISSPWRGFGVVNKEMPYHTEGPVQFWYPARQPRLPPPVGKRWKILAKYELLQASAFFRAEHELASMPHLGPGTEAWLIGANVLPLDRLTELSESDCQVCRRDAQALKNFAIQLGLWKYEDPAVREAQVETGICAASFVICVRHDDDESEDGYVVFLNGGLHEANRSHVPAWKASVTDNTRMPSLHHLQGMLGLVLADVPIKVHLSDEGLQNLTSLRLLVIDRIVSSSISNLPRSIGNLTRLRALYLDPGSAYFRGSIPYELFQLPALEHL